MAISVRDILGRLKEGSGDLLEELKRKLRRAKKKVSPKKLDIKKLTVSPRRFVAGQTAGDIIAALSKKDPQQRLRESPTPESFRKAFQEAVPRRVSNLQRGQRERTQDLISRGVRPEVAKQQAKIEPFIDIPGAGFIRGTGKKIARSVVQRINPRTGAKEFFKKALRKADDLTAQARKFKTAEEFVRAQPTLYHGTGELFSSPRSMAQLRRAKSNVEPSNIGGSSEFIHVTEDRQLAEGYAKARQSNIRGKPQVKEFFVDGKILDKTQDNTFGFQTLERGGDRVVNELKEGGYVGVRFIDKDFIGRHVKTIAILPENVKTKSQLTDIFNQAKGLDSQAGFLRPSELIPKPLRKKLGLEGISPETGRKGESLLATVAAKAKKRERGFVTSAKELIPEADKIAGQYIPRSTDELAIKAKNLIKDNAVRAEEIATTQTNERAVAIASELLKKYADDASRADPIVANALYEKAANVANNIARKLTEQGRTIQAASILGRLTPEGQVKFAAKEILKHNELNPLKQIPKLTGEQSKKILDEMAAINAMGEGAEKAIRFQKLQNSIQDLVPTLLFKKVVAVWKAGLLTGIKTSGLNLFSNLSHAATEVIKDIPAVAVDSVASLFTGKRTKTFTTGRGAGLKEGFDKGVQYLTTGFDERNIAAKLDYRRVNFGKGFIAKVFQSYTDIVFRALGAADQPFYYGALSRSLIDQAAARAKNVGLKSKEAVKYADNLIRDPTEEMIRYATADATTAVFQNKTQLGEVARGIQKLGKGAGEVILPFGRTPSAVAMQIINYSPIGIVKTIMSNIGRGKFDQRLFSQGIGRGLTGTAVMAVGMKMAEKGMVALDYPTGPGAERLRELEKAEGVKNNSIKINGKWKSPIVLGPAGNLLLIGAHFQVAKEEHGSPTEALSKAMLGSLKSFLEQTFLTGVKQFVNAVTEPKRYAKSYLPNLVSSFPFSHRSSNHLL